MRTLPFIAIALLLIPASCSFEPKARFAKKHRIAVCAENQGMVTYAVNLYADSTFYVPSIGLVEYSYGTFRIQGDSIEFIKEAGQTNLCEKYSYDTTMRILRPRKECGTDYLDLYNDH